MIKIIEKSRGVKVNNKWQKGLITFFRGWGFSIIIAILIATSFKSAIADWNDVPTGSMRPTIFIGDRVFVNKLAYDFKIPYTRRHLLKWSDPKRGDIVVFFSPIDGTRLIKRIIGLPGDVILIDKKRLFINGKAIGYEAIDQAFPDQSILQESANHDLYYEVFTDKKHLMMLNPSSFSNHIHGPRIVPIGHYFMMGDNRDNSADSRYFGFVERSLIVGRATTIVLSRDGSILNPRWNRWFKKLL